MRFCFIFLAFFMNYRVFLGGCLHFLSGLSDLFYFDKEFIIVYFWILIKELLSLFRHQKRAILSNYLNATSAICSIVGFIVGVLTADQIKRILAWLLSTA